MGAVTLRDSQGRPVSQPEDFFYTEAELDSRSTLDLLQEVIYRSENKGRYKLWNDKNGWDSWSTLIYDINQGKLHSVDGELRRRLRGEQQKILA